MPIVGTAGHVDHGKSTLVRALTGIDPDRWAEEKERGLTIDLGFAWSDIGGHDVGFVDVPGHERFIKNMLAGVGAIDGAMFVVAADSGWMPQSEEHAAVLDLLGIERGVIALSRIDLVDDDLVELATLDVLDRIEGTSLEGWPIVPVSPVTGSGLDDLRAALADILDATPPRDTEGFRMWVDRAFRPSGAGLVVTGTVLEGSVAPGDTVEVLPRGETATVRGIQHHGGSVERGVAGSRTAINLSGGPDGIDRGTLLAAPETVAISDRMLGTLMPARGFEDIPDRGAFHVHAGTAAVPATIRRVRPTSAYVITTDQPLPVVVGDRIILRETGRRAVVGGGVVLDPAPVARPTAEQSERLAEAAGNDTGARADALTEVHGAIGDLAIRRATGGGRPRRGLRAGDDWLSPGEADRLAASIEALVADHHERHPMRPGLPNGEAASRLDVSIDVIDTAVHRSDALDDRSGAIALIGFSDEMDDASIGRWEAVRIGLEASFDVPRASAIELDDEVLHHLIRRGDLVRIADDLVFTRAQVDEIVRRVAELPAGFTVAEFRDHFGMARRQAVPTLEWLDSIGRTRRHGDGREVRERSGGP